ncbi:Polysaccharide deacetylase [Desulfurella amilsii]|uniref:Polysaccharide deacetylase n=1 Tax=Desulfurella amilsii TaxID=1562698 RepID=A0A1X4XXS0_9BACT|nr:polysaccharide deacetylase family protein [Desulfurella amilsii]OSS42329.1 Polysaccharide deacetylase [Desulfurella amilsii]
MVIIALLFLAIIVFLLRYNFFRLPKKGLVVLLYHSVTDKKSFTSLDKFSVSISKFEKQIKFLKKMGYESARTENIDEILTSELYKTKKYVLITFDDGYKNNLDAAEILKKYNFSAIFFIATGYIGKSLDNTPMLDENDIERLISLGMEIGSHSHLHIKLSELPQEEIIDNIRQSKQILSKLGNIDDFAYPFGNYDNMVIGVLKSYHFKRAYIIGQSVNTAQYNPYLIKRSIIRKSTNYLDLYLILTRGRSRI